MCFAKSHGEWLLTGKAFSSNATPVTTMQVSAALGKSKKVINVVGNRSWNGSRFSSATEIEPFTCMALNYQHAYGGVGHSHNPLGKGVITKANIDQPTDKCSLANLYLPAEKTTADNDARSVACFEPLDISLPQRTKFHGSYDQNWLDHVHPGFPHDTKPRFFNAAPQDQQIKGSITPGEAYELKGMHPSESKIRGKLPQLHIRAFVIKADGCGDNSDDISGDKFIEIDTAIDTVWFFPELELGLAIYRGKIEVNDSDGLDIKTLMLAYERVGDIPKTDEYYQEILSLRSDKKTASAHVLNESQLKPKKTPDEKLHIKKLYQQAKDDHQKKRVQHLDQLVKNQQITEQQKQQSLLKDDKGFIPIPQELVDSGDIDLSKYTQQEEQITSKKLDDAHVKLALIEKIQINRKAGPFEKEESLHQRVFNPVFVSDQRNNRSDAGDTDKDHQTITAKSQRKSRQSAPSCTVLSVPMADAGARAIRCWVLDILEQGGSLAGRDLAGADLHGIDFSHQDLTDVMLEKSDLSGCVFKKSLLNGAVLTESNLNQAIFDEASLQQANLSKVKSSQVSFMQADLTGVNLTGTTLDHCDFTEAILNRARIIETDLCCSCFDHVQCQKGQFLQATMLSTTWRHSAISACNFVQCNIRRSSWQHANIYRTVMVDLKAEASDFSEVKAEKVQFSNIGEYQNTNLSNGHWKSCGFRAINLTRSTVKSSVFEHCDFGESKLNEADLSFSVFKSCTMKQATFNHSVCRDALFALSSLKKTSFVRTDLRGTKFQNTNLKEAIFTDCQLENTITQPIASLT